jgi:hypothetical protein
LNASPRIFAIDWSGALKGSRKKIWLAEVSGDRLLRLESGWDRREVIHHVIEESEKTPRIIVGLDFAFSCPGWFVRSKECGTVHEFWKLAEEQGESWLKEWPFWSKCKTLLLPKEEYRLCEKSLTSNPSSVFKLVGAAQVGRGSIRGIPFLLHMHRNGFSIWPFDPPGWPRAVEIYPRLFTPGIIKSDPNKRREYVYQYRGRCSSEALSQAAKCDDAFDALVSAFAMSDRLEELSSLNSNTDPEANLEGAIWFPHYGPDPTRVESRPVEIELVLQSPSR